MHQAKQNLKNNKGILSISDYLLMTAKNETTLENKTQKIGKINGYTLVSLIQRDSTAKQNLLNDM